MYLRAWNSLKILCIAYWLVPYVGSSSFTSRSPKWLCWPLTAIELAYTTRLTPARRAASKQLSMPRMSRRMMSRGPMKPVAPITSTDMPSLLVLPRGLPGDHAPLLASLRVDRQVADGEAILLAVPLHVHVRHAVDDADISVNARPSLARRDTAVVRLARAKIRDVLGLRLLARGGVDVRQVVGQRAVERGPVGRSHRLESTVVGTENVRLDPGLLSRHCRHESLLYTPAGMGVVRAPARHAGITCLPNISMDCSARSCGMVSVCVIRIT